MIMLKYLCYSILIVCFLNLIFVLIYWVGIVSDYLLIVINYGFSVLIILMVLLNMIVLIYYLIIMFFQ